MPVLSMNIFSNNRSVHKNVLKVFIFVVSTVPVDYVNHATFHEPESIKHCLCTLRSNCDLLEKADLHFLY